jgi:hypothetical protein
VRTNMMTSKVTLKRNEKVKERQNIDDDEVKYRKKDMYLYLFVCYFFL